MNYKQMMAEYNTKYFGGILGRLQLFMNPRKTYNRCGVFRGKTFRIEIYYTNPLMKSEKDLKETLLHEMTHAYLWEKAAIHCRERKIESLSLFNQICRRSCGHNANFKLMLSRILREEFGNIVLGNVRFKQNIVTKEVPVSTILPNVKVIPDVTIVKGSPAYKVISNGKIGEFINEVVLYGRKHVRLKIDGMMFPFVTPIDNVVCLTN